MNHLAGFRHNDDGSTTVVLFCTGHGLSWYSNEGFTATLETVDCPKCKKKSVGEYIDFKRIYSLEKPLARGELEAIWREKQLEMNARKMLGNSYGNPPKRPE
jgi:hypothetical protein